LAIETGACHITKPKYGVMKVFENRVPRRIFWTQERGKNMRKLHNKELYNLYSSLYIVYREPGYLSGIALGYGLDDRGFQS
jgi:hypothetical protein